MIFPYIIFVSYLYIIYVSFFSHLFTCIIFISYFYLIMYNMTFFFQHLSTACWNSQDKARANDKEQAGKEESKKEEGEKEGGGTASDSGAFSFVFFCFSLCSLVFFRFRFVLISWLACLTYFIVCLFCFVFVLSLHTCFAYFILYFFFRFRSSLIFLSAFPFLLHLWNAGNQNLPLSFFPYFFSGFSFRGFNLSWIIVGEAGGLEAALRARIADVEKKTEVCAYLGPKPYILNPKP